MKKLIRLAAIALSAALAFVIAGCSSGGTTGSSNTSEEKIYTQQDVMSVIEKGLEARWKINDTAENDEGNSDELLKKAVQAEIDIDAELRNCKYDNSKLQEDVISYLNLLDDSMEVIDTYSYDSAEYDDAWNDVYKKRTAMIKVFVDDYGLKMSSEEQQKTLEDMFKEGATVQKQTEIEDAINSLVEKAKFKKTKEGSSYYEYTATIENTTQYDFKDVSITLALYDSDGVKADETYASTNSWKKGEKVKFDASSDTNAKRIEATVDYYDVVE